jgi:glycosyltransferase involved in cell wall biosynthesis
MKFSFLMVVKNEEKYIRDAIGVFLKHKIEYSWELIIVDDKSDDSTFNILKEYILDARIRVYKNTGCGKIDGVNYAYSQSSGDILKCIDGDDVLSPHFFRTFSIMTSDAACHNLANTDQNLNFISRYRPRSDFFKRDYIYVIQNLIILPKACWVFKRALAERIFPIPKSIPFEDSWISFMIKKNASSILLINHELYLYRQHDNQTYGGISNFNRNILKFRAGRIIKLINQLCDQPSINEKINIDNIRDILKDQFKFYSFLSSDFNIVNLIRAFLTIKPSLCVRYILYAHFSRVATWLQYIKWVINGK